MGNKPFAQVMREHKTALLLIVIGLLLVELEVFAVAAMRSGRKSQLQVFDARNNLIYETDGKNLSDFNKYYFEKTFGPLSQYEVRLATRQVDFPFRAWFTAALGIPLGVVLLFAFVMKAYLALVGDDERAPPEVAADAPSRLEAAMQRISRMNIFIIGFILFLGVVGYWVVPNSLVYIGKNGMELLIRFKWVVLGVSLVVLGLVIWIIYLRYLLARKAIESQVAVDKYRLALESGRAEPLPALEYEGPRPAVENPEEAPDIVEGEIIKTPEADQVPNASK